MLPGDALRASIEQYLSGSIPLHGFWKTFNFGFADAPDGAFSEAEDVFFARVDDELHHTDSETPPDAALGSDREFHTWLKEAYARFQAAG
jgi:hypothetical protein